LIPLHATALRAAALPTSGLAAPHALEGWLVVIQ
jgi:hypothetical protein